MSVLVTRIEGAVALLTLNRPRRLNALDRELLGALDASFAAVAQDAAVRSVVVTGAGTRAFCAGADVNELDRVAPEEAFELMRFGQATFDRIAELPKPVIAAVNGLALGGGCELSLACDVRFAAADACFAQPEITLANVPGWGGTQRLPRLIGSGRAAEMIFSGRSIDARTACAWGLANRVCEQQQLLEQTLAFAEQIAAHSPVALAGAKRAMAHGFAHGQQAGLLVEAQAVAECCGTEQQRAAVGAFLAREGRQTSRSR